jgi:hypothetical protein
MLAPTSNKDAELIALLHAKIDEISRGDARVALEFIHAFSAVAQLQGRIGADVVGTSLAFLRQSGGSLPEA